LAAYLLMLREGVEAALVVGILLAYLTQLNRRQDFKYVWWGTGAAAALSFGVGWVIYSTIGELDETSGRIAGGIVAFAACALLTWMIFWMARQSRSIKPALHTKVDQAVATGSALAIGSVAFVAVLREGLESALFLISTTIGEAVGRGLLLGAALGILTAVGIGYLIYRGGSRLNLRVFFRVTGMLLVLFAAGLVSKGIHTFQEAGVIPVIIEDLWNLPWADPSRSLFWNFAAGLFGWSSEPSLLMVLGYFGYLVPVSIKLWRATKPAPRLTPQVSGLEDAELRSGGVRRAT
jgi:high-affinity iron transporter